MLMNLVDTKDQKENARRNPTELRHKHTRQRSSSLGATIYSSTLPPPRFTPLDSEALSSLITSLTSISEAQKTATDGERAQRSSTGKDSGDLFQRITINSDFQQSLYQDKSVDKDNEEDFCPPPVAGYNTINASSLLGRPRTSGNDSAARKPKKRTNLNLKISKSQGTLVSKELKSPDSLPPHPRTSCNESIASLPLSTNSKLSSKSPFRMFFSTRSVTEPSLPDHLSIHKTSDGSCEPRTSVDKDLDAHRFSAFVRLDNIQTDLNGTPPDAKTLASISPSTRTDLNENLIPSRRSSLRSGPGQRSSRGSRDLKSLNIDQDLIEENHETVQRIRELQQARERRHNEWRKEAKKSEKSTKRSSIHMSNSSPVKQSTSVRSSWHSKVTDLPDNEDKLDVSARVDGQDLAGMPAYVEMGETEPLTPVQTPQGAASSEIRRQASITASTTQSVSSVRRHRQRLSDSIKRASSIRQSVPDDAKGVADEVEAFLGSPRFTQRIRHPRTGRTITFSEVGDPNGFVVLCCVGMGLTRYVTSFYDEIAKAQKLRIITPDRPGVGETEAMPAERSTPLAWVDDVAVICSSLGVEKFSLLAHSAGAIYALATALKMPQYVRGRIHLLGPWIPPSQLALSLEEGDTKAANLPTSHKILSFLPVSFMKAANSRFLSATSASIEPRTRKDRKKDKGINADLMLDADLFNQEPSLSRADITQHHINMLPTPDTTPSNTRSVSQPLSCYQAEQQARSPPLSPTPGNMFNGPSRSATLSPSPSATGTRTPTSHYRALTPQARTRLYNTTLTHRTWTLATLNANPAVDLVICLERRRPIGFRFTDITRSVVIHHGANDGRVPLENIKWLASVMKRCELRVLENEGHGLMASASVMSEVLSEVGREWEEWSIADKERQRLAEEERRKSEEARRGTRKGYPRW